MNVTGPDVTPEARPLVPECNIQRRFDALLDRLCPGENRLAVAVSGGSDSTALLVLAVEWAKARSCKVLVVTIDHGLRAEAGQEAARVGALAADLGAAHRAVKWAEPRPQAQHARRARHQLLARAARRFGARHILLGHTLDDQLETFLIRRRHGSEAFGLGGMDLISPSPVWPAGRSLRLVRPLLEFRRVDLRGVLGSAGVDWIDDPTNQDEAYERVRVRNQLAGTPGLLRSVQECQSYYGAQRRDELHDRARDLRAGVQSHADGHMTFDPKDMSQSRLAALLGVLVQIAGGHDRQTRSEGLKALAKTIQEGGLSRPLTLGGAWICRQDGHVMIGRDPGGVPCHGRLLDGVWDGRFEPGGRVQPSSKHVLQRRTLPPDGPGWRAVIGARLDEICDIWRQV